MSEVPVEERPVAKPLPMPIRLTIAAGIVILLIVIVGWAGVANAKSQRRDAFSQGVTALGASLTESVLLSDRDRAKTGQLLQRIATEAGYSSISLTDGRGKIFASTDRTMENQDLPDFAKVSTETVVRTVNGKWVATRGVYLGSNNRIGAIQVTLSP